MNILVTGCNGQLGNEMQLLEKEYPQHSWFNTDVEELDITSQLAVEQFVAQHQIDGIVNCAAYTAVDKAEDNKEQCTTLNTVAPSYLAAAVEKRGGWLVQISTDYVFNGTKYTPYVETDTPCPDSVYGSTKLAGELGVSKFCKRSMIIRTAWLYSTFGNNFVKTMIRLGKEKPGVYHFSNEGVISWYDFTKAIHRLAGITTCHVRPLHTSEYPTPAHRPHYSVLDKTKLKQTYGIEVPYWEDSLAECIAKL